MRSNKAYSNVTFSKRVDHDAGRHRENLAPAEPASCRTCGAVYAGKRWRLARRSVRPKSQAIDKRKSLHPATLMLCPACKKRREDLPAGFLYISGKFLSVHREEVVRLLYKEAKRAFTDNPLARVMRTTSDKDGRIVVATTTEHLVKRLGHALKKALDGEVRYDFSHENKFARVYWNRD